MIENNFLEINSSGDELEITPLTFLEKFKLCILFTCYILLVIGKILILSIPLLLLIGLIIGIIIFIFKIN